MKSLLYYFITILTLSSYTYAIDWEKCEKEMFIGPKGASGPPALITAAASSFAFTVSYVSSIGPCGALASERRKVQFFLVNHDKIINDIAKGEGEYFASFAFMFNRPYTAEQAIRELQLTLPNWIDSDKAEQYRIISKNLEFELVN